jgi:putative flippase GtrA
MRFVRFNVVGAIGIIVQLALIWLLADVAGWRADAATAVAVTATVLHNFVWHLRWTWADRAPRGRAVVSALARFALTNGLLSLAGNVAIVFALTDRWHVPAVGANAIAIVVCGVINYAAANVMVFTPASRATVSAVSVADRRQRIHA